MDPLLNGNCRDIVCEDLLILLWAGVHQRFNSPKVSEFHTGILNGLAIAVAVASDGLDRDRDVIDIEELAEAGKVIASQRGPL